MVKKTTSRPNPHQVADLRKVVVAKARELYAFAMQSPDAYLSSDDAREGLRLSRNEMSQKTEVPVTPLMKHALEKFGDAKGAEWRLTIDTPMTKAEEEISKRVATEIKRLFGYTPESDFDTTKPVDDFAHYGVDCVRNWKEGTDNRQVQPGQATERKEAIERFMVKEDPETIFQKIEADPLWDLVFQDHLDLIPCIVADDDLTETKGPFENKHSNVGAPYFRNDQTVDPETGKTYGQLSFELADKILKDGLKWTDITKYNICTGLARNQRKGRLITALSRVCNMLINMIERPEIEAAKAIPLFVGYNDDAKLREALRYMAHVCTKYPEIACANWDQSKFDLHINPAFIAIAGALRWFKCKGSRAKKLCEYRTALGLKSKLVDGLSGRIESIYGRMFSGGMDTNKGDGHVEANIFAYALAKMDKTYFKSIVYRFIYYMLTMGDDLLALYNRKSFDPETLTSIMREYGFELNIEKGEFGTFFLQYRFFTKDGEEHMVYAFTRVLRSMLFLERTKGLGPAGWLLAQYQQLSKLVDYPPALDAAIAVILDLDELSFGVDLSVDQIIDMVKDEDETAANNNKRSKSTFEALFDGDPTKARMWDSSGAIKHEWLSSVHTAISESVARVRARTADQVESKL